MSSGVQTPTVPSSTISIEFARSWLLVSAAETHRFGAPTEADVTVIDLEDGVVGERRATARHEVVRFLQTSDAWVRINPCGTTDYSADVTALQSVPGLQGVVLAKTESAEQISTLVTDLPGIAVVALVETALGIECAFEIASTPGTTRLAFGKGDYRRDTLTADEPGALAYARGRLVNASRAARLPGPIDGPCLAGMPALEEATKLASDAGMTGLLCIDPTDAPVINRRFVPSPADITWAMTVIDRLGENGENITAGCDLPMLARARRILMLVEVFESSPALPR
ncbi:HpcH/HpaI aldolase/citrate lyase family protein [Nocardia coubleae]|uniref:CoA ester lyase n=1 Tax=Nocardia coubleae TaxID=356147 RepID=A0A846W2K3_9NOCA|nr:aldolase/citrate lyase family protein [Nocardia coubleae]NKX86877.1 CoA ester lyase [Nocardia coubleae]